MGQEVQVYVTIKLKSLSQRFEESDEGDRQMGFGVVHCLKKNQNAPRPSEHPPVMGKKMSKRLGGIKGCKYKTSSWHLSRFPDADNIGSTV